MYDGIGLPTPRGSGTSGYIQRNLGHLKPRRDFRAEQDTVQALESKAPKWKKSEELLEHKRKRDIENKVLVFRESLSESLGEEEVKKRCNLERTRLLALDASLGGTGNKQAFGKDTSKLDSHQVAELKTKQTEAFRTALRISADDSARRTIGTGMDKTAKQPPATAPDPPAAPAPASSRRENDVKGEKVARPGRRRRDREESSSDESSSGGRRQRRRRDREESSDESRTGRRDRRRGGRRRGERKESSSEESSSEDEREARKRRKRARRS